MRKHLAEAHHVPVLPHERKHRVPLPVGNRRHLYLVTGYATLDKRLDRETRLTRCQPLGDDDVAAQLRVSRQVAQHLDRRHLAVADGHAVGHGSTNPYAVDRPQPSSGKPQRKLRQRGKVQHPLVPYRRDGIRGEDASCHGSSTGRSRLGCVRLVREQREFRGVSLRPSVAVSPQPVKLLLRLLPGISPLRCANAHAYLLQLIAERWRHRVLRYHDIDAIEEVAYLHRHLGVRDNAERTVVPAQHHNALPSGWKLTGDNAVKPLRLSHMVLRPLRPVSAGQLGLRHLNLDRHEVRPVPRPLELVIEGRVGSMDVRVVRHSRQPAAILRPLVNMRPAVGDVAFLVMHIVLDDFRMLVSLLPFAKLNRLRLHLQLAGLVDKVDRHGRIQLAADDLHGSVHLHRLLRVQSPQQVLVLDQREPRPERLPQIRSRSGLPSPRQRVGYVGVRHLQPKSKVPQPAAYPSCQTAPESRPTLGLLAYPLLGRVTP